MNLTLQRLFLTPRSTCGELSIDGQSRLCYTLELPVKDGLPGSAIPPGRYKIELAPSPKFLASIDPWVKKYAPAMPHPVDIPGRSLIMLHWGNTPSDTDGCILVGLEHGLDSLGRSREAFELLHEQLTGECSIDVQGGLPLAGKWPNE